MTREGEPKSADQNFSAPVVDLPVDAVESIDTDKTTEAETIKVVESELFKLDAISEVEDNEEQKKLVNSHIENILVEFDLTKKTQKDFRLMMGKLELIGLSHALDKNIVDRSWNQDQVDKVIKTFEENEKGNKVPGGGYDYFPRYYSLFTTGSKNGREKNTISDLFAESIAKRLEEKKVLSGPLNEEVKTWCNNIHMADKDVRLEFLISVLNNIGKMDSSTSHEAVAFMGLYGSKFIREIKTSFEENKNDINEPNPAASSGVSGRVFYEMFRLRRYFSCNHSSPMHSIGVFWHRNKTLRIVEILNFLKNKDDEAGFEIAGWEAGKILSEIKNDNKNYFIQAHVDKAENSNRMAALKRKLSYDDDDLRNNYVIAVYEAEDNLYNGDNLIAASCYSRVNDKYGVLYDHRGKIDSLFELKESINTGEKFKQEKLDIGEVLAQEGFKKENMSEEEYKKIILTYKTLIELPMREKIENEFGIELKNFSIREQVQFVNFLSSKTVEEIEEVKEFLNQGENDEAKNNRIKAFLSLESGREMGEKILNIGENLDARSADAVFAKYSEIISLTDKTREDLGEIFKDKKDVSEIEREKIIQNLMRKGGQLLIEFSDKEEPEKEKLGSEAILEELEKAKVDLIFMASLLAILKKEGKREDIEIENFKGVTFEKRTVNELTNGGEITNIIDNICNETGKKSAVDISESSLDRFLNNKNPDIDKKDQKKIKNVIGMIKMYHDNYRDSPEMQEKLVTNFENLLREGKSDTDIFALLKDDSPYAFCRFDDLGNETKYAASLNVDPKMQGSAIGQAFFEKCMEENKKYTVLGDCSLVKPLVCTHIEKNGFVAKEVYDFSGELSVKIERPGENKKTYEYKGLDNKEIIDQYEKEFLNNKYNKSSSRFILKFEDKSKDLYDTIENLLNNEHYSLTRYFSSDEKDKNGKKEVYCAFEKD